MNRSIRQIVRYGLAAVAGAGCLLINENRVLVPDGSLVTSAEARIGRPLTPLSYAGVARRTTRRAVVYGAAAGAVVAPVVVAPLVAPRCVQAVDAYGRVYRRCY